MLFRNKIIFTPESLDDRFDQIINLILVNIGIDNENIELIMDDRDIDNYITILHFQSISENENERIIVFEEISHLIGQLRNNITSDMDIDDIRICITNYLQTTYNAIQANRNTRSLQEDETPSTQNNEELLAYELDEPRNNYNGTSLIYLSRALEDHPVLIHDRFYNNFFKDLINSENEAIRQIVVQRINELIHGTLRDIEYCELNDFNIYQVRIFNGVDIRIFFANIGGRIVILDGYYKNQGDQRTALERAARTAQDLQSQHDSGERVIAQNTRSLNTTRTEQQLETFLDDMSTPTNNTNNAHVIENPDDDNDHPNNNNGNRNRTPATTNNRRN
ncbi:hypothetical protein ACFL56_01800 [Candidatus Margulisiibacteriota bacterium]